MADTLSLPQASVVGAVLLVAAAAGYGLLMVDERLGTLHLPQGMMPASPGELRDAAHPGAGANAANSAATAPGDTGHGGTGHGGARSAKARAGARGSADNAAEAGASSGAGSGTHSGADAAGGKALSGRHSKVLPADASGSDGPGGFNQIAPPAYLAGIASPTPLAPGLVSDRGPTDRRFVIRRILPIDGPIRYGEWHWDETGVPPGPLVITVDLEARVISAFRAGSEIGTAAVLLGTQQYPTPTGVFPITQKDAHHISNIYDAPMPYMMRLTSDGVTIHGSNVRNGFASHGCIGVPIAFAKLLFEHVHLGDRVYITRGKQVGLGDTLVDR